MPAITVAVVIPTLNEALGIREHLAMIIGDADEIVVSDGGSTDSTLAIATELGVPTVQGGCGRGPQLNRGAAATSSEVLLFLHADTLLPDGGLEAIRHCISRGAIGGGFRARFDHPGPLFRLGSNLVNLRTRLTGTPLGDQAQFVCRRAFEHLGGFHDWPILEDLDFMRRLRRQGPITIIDRPVETSARRYLHNGVLRTIANNWLIWLLFFLGWSPDRLAARYRHVR